MKVDVAEGPEGLRRVDDQAVGTFWWYTERACTSAHCCCSQVATQRCISQTLGKVQSII